MVTRHVSCGSWLCKNAKTLSRERRTHSSKIVLVAECASRFNLAIELKNIILGHVSIFAFLHSQGHQRRLSSLTDISALPRTADIRMIAGVGRCGPTTGISTRRSVQFTSAKTATVYLVLGAAYQFSNCGVLFISCMSMSICIQPTGVAEGNMAKKAKKAKKANKAKKKTSKKK